jgi:hypothetical protein
MAGSEKLLFSLSDQDDLVAFEDRPVGSDNIEITESILAKPLGHCVSSLLCITWNFDDKLKKHKVSRKVFGIFFITTKR